MKAIVANAEWAPRPGYTVSDKEQRTGRAENGSQVWRNPVWQVTDHPQPSVSAPDEVVLRVKAAGMCGSDVHMWETDTDGYQLLAYRTKFPVVLGHEFSGEVVEIGSDVTRFTLGDAACAEEVTWCGECRYCQQGMLNQCMFAEDYGLTLDGGFAEYVVVKQRYLWSLNTLRERYDQQKVFTLGALTEPTSVAYEGLFRRSGGFEPGSDVVVFGAGPIGLAAIQLSVAAGAGRVIAVETQQGRRDIATNCGADLVLDPNAVAAGGSTVGAEIRAYTHGAGVPFIVEASGFHQAVFPEIATSLDVNGKLVLLGMDAQPAPFLAAQYQMLGARVYGSLGHCGGNFGRTISLHAAGRIDMSNIVTSEFALTDGLQAVEQTARRADAKVLLRP